MSVSAQQMTAQKPPSVASESLSHQLAIEMATGLYSLDDLVIKFDISKTQIKRIGRDPHFKRVFAEAKALWNSDGNVQERVRRKSALLLEDSILPIYSIIQDASLAPGPRIDAFAKLRSTADMEPTKGGDGAVKESFTLNIMMGADSKSVTIDSETLEVEGEDDLG